MKILYIAHYKEFGGWAQAATDYILALDSIGVDVVCRNVTLTEDKQEVNSRLLELEKKSTDGCDIIIQHVLPHHLVGYTKTKKNIAILESETISIKHLNWFEQLKVVDEIWVPNADAKKALDDDNIGKPVAIIPHATNVNQYKKQYSPISIPNAKNNFKFYYIGDMNDRKNLDTVISCYHSEFSPSENTNLILKINKFGFSSQQLSALLDQKLSSIKKSLRIYSDLSRYDKDITICDKASNEAIMQLHQYCDCFLCPSHGEAWSIPSFDAMAFGNTPICSNFGGPKDFIDNSKWRTGTLINGVYSICKCSDAAFPDLFTAREYWFQPCEKQIREQMRAYFESWKKDPMTYKSKNQAQGLKRAEQYSYKNIASKMLEAIND